MSYPSYFKTGTKQNKENHMLEKTSDIEPTNANPLVLSISESPEKSLFIRDLNDRKLSVGVWRLFPLSAQRLAKFCSHCQILGMPFPLNAFTGEVQRLGFFYRQRLIHECRLVLPFPLDFDDYWLLRQSSAFFQMNKTQFQCHSIGLALDIIRKHCEAYDMALQRSGGENQW